MKTAYYMIWLTIILYAIPVWGSINHPVIEMQKVHNGTISEKFVDDRAFGNSLCTSAKFPGVLGLDSGGADWPNFIIAAQAGYAYSVDTVTLRKEIPAFRFRGKFIPAGTITQTGSQNIRTWWPLLYDPIGTRYTLTLSYTTSLKILLPGEATPSTSHTESWNWIVGSNIQGLKTMIDLCRRIPFGKSCTSLISDQNLLKSVSANLASATAAYTSGDYTSMNTTLDSVRSKLAASAITKEPTLNNASVPGLGTADSLENPTLSALQDYIASLKSRASETISAAIELPSTIPLEITKPVTVTYVSDGWFYVEDTRRICGIKVVGDHPQISRGDLVTLSGTVETLGPERILRLIKCVVVKSGGELPAPLGLNCHSVGGQGSGFLPGFDGAAGLWNGGLRIRIFGRVTGAGDGYFLINDGSASHSLRILLPAETNTPQAGSFVSVTGISSWFDESGIPVPAVYMESPDDIQTLYSSTPVH